jgi:lipopolysaccharide export system protein LptA
MKKTILIALISIFAFANDLKIISDEYNGDNKKGVSVFSGNVKATLKSDKLNADEITIYTNKSNKPKKLIAKGNVEFFVKTEDGSKYEGRSNKAIYLPQEKLYEFLGDVKIMQLDDKKEIIGQEVKVDLVNSTAKAKSSKDKPVVMIFEVEEKNTTKKIQE